MSSAALQPAPHQSTTITSLSPVASPSPRQYPSQTSQSREQYYNQQPSNASQSSSTRRPSRRPSGNGTNSPSTQSQSTHQSPTVPAPNLLPTTSRPPVTSVQVPSPSTAGQSVGHPTPSPTEYQRGIPPVAPPRTSSNQRSAAGSATASMPHRSRRGGAAAEDRPSDSPRGASSADGLQDGDFDRMNGNRSTNEREREKSRDETGAAVSGTSSRSRRRAQPAQHDPVPQRSNSTRETRPGQPVPAAHSRSQGLANTSASSPSGPSRETSEILNRMVVSTPEVDLDRERERLEESVPHDPSEGVGITPVTGLSVVGSEGVEDGGRGGGRSRHDHAASSSKREKSTKFGDYYLGNTLGEGEFGKVKMGWKQEGGVQVAIKLIRRDSVGSNPTRLAKIYREIAILREISHPNIVRLHEMVETEKHIGIILEYASGGELFDYILNHRYLKDSAARRLFAQLVSGVGYLHKKGIVHRDLKLENLLLDRNRNIIITDFGFANTFNPNDELGEEIEYNLSNREYVKRMELDKILPGGFRRGDLMQTSCGSPCYAAPELVVSDSLYTGRKVDVWSCGVILYAMLAGYLPFDDDPANPEGDNINLLYKYIVSTPLTFPEYVTPHARDLLRRILVPDPRKRADLFEVARHSWLNEYAHVVGFITSSTTTSSDIANTTIGAEEPIEAPLLARSASVREPTKTQKPEKTAIGDLARKHGTVDQDADDAYAKSQKDNKRRTVQVEYVAPRSQTVRGEDGAPAASSQSRYRNDDSVEVPLTMQPDSRRNVEKPLPQDPPSSAREAQFPDKKSRQQGMPPPARPGREVPRSVSDNAFMTPLMMATSGARPNTGGSLASTGSGRGSMGLTARGSYGQPVAPTVAGTNAHGRMSQPKSGKNYVISSPVAQEERDSDYGRPSISQVPSKFAKVAGFPDGSDINDPKGHKRSNTIGGIGEKIFGRHGSIFGGKTAQTGQEKPKKSYPPVSMSGTNYGPDTRQSIDSGRRSISFGFSRKRSGSIAGSGGGSSTQEKPRRFSLLPTSFSLKAIGIGKDYGTPGAPPDGDYYNGHAENVGGYPEPPYSRGQIRSAGVGSSGQNLMGDGTYSQNRDSPVMQERRAASMSSPPQHHRYASQPQPFSHQQSANPQYANRTYRPQEEQLNQSDSSLSYPTNTQNLPPSAGRYAPGLNAYEGEGQRATGERMRQGVLQKNARKFTDAYEQEQTTGTHSNAGSSGAARKVMDFFRRRGKAREGEER